MFIARARMLNPFPLNIYFINHFQKLFGSVSNHVAHVHASILRANLKKIINVNHNSTYSIRLNSCLQANPAHS